MNYSFRTTLKSAVVAVAALFLLSLTPDQGMAEFYKGKTVTVLIGYSAGGGIDTMARVFTETLGDFLPGNPNIVIKTMPGAGGNKSRNFVYSKGSKDGTLIWFGPVNFLDQAIGGEGIRYNYADFDLICALRVPPPVMYTRTDIVEGGLKSTEDILKAKGLKLAGRNPKGNLDLMGRTALDLLGVPFKYVTGYKGGAKTRLAIQSGEMDIEVTGIGIYKTATSEMVKEGLVKGLWYMPYFDFNNQPIKDEALSDLPHFFDAYRKLKGKDPEGPAWDVLKLLTEYGSLASTMFFMPPDTNKEAVEVMRKGVAEMMKTEELKKRQMKILSFTADVVPLAAVEKKIKEMGSLDQGRLENYKSYIAAGSKK